MVRVERLDVKPALLGLCVGYELGRWRCKEFADHMMEWLPEFALSYSERESLSAATAVRLLRAAARSIYKTGKFEGRGEFGELLLHIVVRQVFSTVPAISKIYYKDSPNDTVKGFDAVHVVVAGDALELWLGEVKFYSDISQAIAHAVTELEDHTRRDYLRMEFASIVNKIDSQWPHSEKLKMLLDPSTSLDSVFDAICIPVLLTYESEVVRAHKQTTSEYVCEFVSEVTMHHATFKSRSAHLPPLRICLFLVPLKSKGNLQKELDRALKRWQKI